MKNNLFVFDTNSLIRAALIQNSVNARALDKAIKTGTIAISSSILTEITEVIFRKKFDKYLNDDQRTKFINRIERDFQAFKINETIAVCRDPSDDKFLDLAITCAASCIITGDQDLLILNPFQTIPILTAAEFLKNF